MTYFHERGSYPSFFREASFEFAFQFAAPIAEHRAAITKYTQPNVRFWFPYATLATVVLGLLLTLMNGYLLRALTFQMGRRRHRTGWR
jgi:hypothetical protein